MRVESICIVGGGTSGWMAAALLSKSHPDIEMCLIESPDIKPIGVGESTLADFNRYLLRLGLKDEDWMTYCNATYKSSIRFKNFKEGKGESFQYPFGAFGPPRDETPFHIQKYFEASWVYDYGSEEFARFVNPLTYPTEHGKITKEIPDSYYNSDTDLAYHLNADKFGEYLRDNIAVPNGVHHVYGEVNNVIKTIHGDISAITTTDGQAISADLFIDCTGFRSLLLEQHMNVPFIPFTDQLFNDRALATHIEYKDKETQMDTFTDCVAMKNGWVYNIPMWNNIGTGYVYSSKYISDAEAEEEFREYLDDQECSLMPIKIKHGKHKVGWVRNVVGIGLAYGFIEPLESTGLVTTHDNIIFLDDILSTRDGHVVNQDRIAYNYATNKLLESYKNFVVNHYTFSMREDTPYWRDATNNVERFYNFTDNPDESSLHAISDYRQLLETLETKVYDPSVLGEGTIYISAGMGYKPFTRSILNERADEERFKQIEQYHNDYCKNKEHMLEWVNTLPSHYQYLKDNIYVESV
tara:strand:- start:6625 stop:8196 length:1572 start_codon:yes stop_codon:yes gene_type:complete